MEISMAEKFSMFLILVASLSVHEFAHAWVSDKLGDPTPRSQGRVTLNPLAHIDLFGTIIIPLMMIMLAPGFIILGWGRPVIFNPKNFKNPVAGEIMATLAGPISNLILATLAAVLVGFWLGHADPAIASRIGSMGLNIVLLNTMLAVFNLIPIPPLDGSHVLRHAIGMSELTFIRWAQWGTLLLLVLINIPFFQHLLQVAINFVATPLVVLMAVIAGA